MPRNGFVKALNELANTHNDLVVLSLNSTTKCRAQEFKKRHPSKHIQTNTSINTALAIAIGLAHENKKAILIANATNLGHSNVRALADKNITLVGIQEGVNSENQNVNDLSFAKSLGMSVICPADSIEARKATLAAAHHPHPTYIRLQTQQHPTTKETSPFSIGHANIEQEGLDLSVIACGNMVHHCKKAARTLAQEGISLEIINSHTIHPIDRNKIKSSVSATACALVVEEHNIHGGLATSVHQTLQDQKVQIATLGITNHTKKDTRYALLEHYRLTPTQIAKAARQLLKTTLNDQVLRHTKLCPDSKAFKTLDGKKINSVTKLYSALLRMPTKTYEHHVNSKKDDFSNWIDQVFGLRTLAAEFKLRKTRLAKMLLLKRYLK